MTSYASTDNIDLDLLDQIDAAFASGGTTAAFNSDTPAGSVVTGVITGVDLRQARDYKTGDPATFSDGSPKREVVVTIETDDGHRAVYISTWGRAKQALGEALGKAGLSKVSEGLRPGNTLAARFNGKKTAVHPRSKEQYEYRDYEYAITVPAAPVPSDPFDGEVPAWGSGIIPPNA